jgi:hypothetical protein
VTRDFSQKEGIIYDEILTFIRIFISLAAVFFFGKLHQIDVKTVFLNGEVEQEAIHGKNPIDCSKLRELGMEELTVSLQSLGFTKSIVDPNLYIKIVCYLRMIPYRKGNFDSSD